MRKYICYLKIFAAVRENDNCVTWKLATTPTLRFAPGVRLPVFVLVFTVGCKKYRPREEEKEEENGQVGYVSSLSPVLNLLISTRKSFFILYKIPKSWINPQQDTSALQIPLRLYRELHPSKL